MKETHSQLYIVEGLPCSGKSTTARYISEVLSNGRNRVIYVDEGNGNHPADYEFQGFITAGELEHFSELERKKLLSCSTFQNDGYIIELSKLSGKLLDKAMKYKIYDFLEWDKERPIMLAKWQDFVNSIDEDIIYVLNCCFLQNPMCETMMRFGFDFEISKEYISAIWEKIKVLNPVIVYLHTSNIAKNIKLSVKERGNDWLKAVIDYHINGEYGRSKGLSGFDGYISCLEERQKRECEILNSLDGNVIMINDPCNDWIAAYDYIEKFINKNIK